MSAMKKEKNKSSVRKEYLLNNNVSFNVMEAFRNLKASLSVSLPKKQSGEGIVLMMTSPCPADGKTTVTVNLALMFAMSNAKVILIDADVRKGRIARYFKVKSAPGLVDYLSGAATLDEIKKTTKDNLTYITCGTSSPRPYELLESEEMKKLITALKQEYDYVIIDTPPVLVVSDAVALAAEVDGTVLICRHQKSYVADIAKTLNTLSFAKANVLGVVVNDYTAKAKKMSGDYKTYEYYE